MSIRTYWHPPLNIIDYVDAGGGGGHLLFASEVAPPLHLRSCTQMYPLYTWIQKLNPDTKAKGAGAGAGASRCKSQGCGGVHPLYTWVQRADEIPVCEVSEV